MFTLKRFRNIKAIFTNGVEVCNVRKGDDGDEMGVIQVNKLVYLMSIMGDQGDVSISPSKKNSAIVLV